MYNRRFVFKVLVGAFVFCAFFSALLFADGEVIRKIEVSGNTAINDSAVLFYTDFEVGKEYSDEAAKNNFRRLWDTGIFDYVSIEVEDYEDGVLVIVKVEEKPVIRNVDYRGAKKVTDSKIEEILKANNVEFKEGSYLDRTAVNKASRIIEGLLASKGYKYASVKSDIRVVSKSERAIIFNIDLGDRLKIKKIRVHGNEKYSDRKIKKAMKKTSEKWAFAWLTRHNVFSEQKIDVDLESVIALYKNNGFVEVDIDEPVIDIRERRIKNKKKGKAERWVFVDLTIHEGLEYRIGNISVEGNKEYKEDEILARVPQVSGDLYKQDVLDRGVGYIGDLYGDKGYIYSHTTMIHTVDPESQTVDLVFNIDEGEPYYLRFLEFSGNTNTKDTVLRREFRISEGELFKKRLFESSLTKLSQLGYFKVTEFPEVTPVEGENKVDVLVKGEESGKNQIEFGGGYSDLEGAFVRGSYSTRNFLGRGEILSFSTQLGGTRDLYSISFTEPWLFGKPYTLGGNIYLSETDYTDFTRESKGVGLSFGFPLTYFTRASIGYSYDKSTTWQDKWEVIGQDADGNDVYGVNGVEEVNSTISKLTPVVAFDTTNHPYTPTRGLKMVGSVTIAGDFLGGDSSFYKPKFQVSWFHKFFKKSYFGLNAEIGFVGGFGGEEIPIYEYFYLGGDSSIRGFESRDIFPREFYVIRSDQDIPYFDSRGWPIGGDKMLLFNGELVFPMNEQFHFVLFADAGNAYLGGYDITHMYYSIGAELRFFVPMFQYPLRLIWAEAMNPEVFNDTKNFTFSIGTTF